jgi:hypothetical protein
MLPQDAAQQWIDEYCMLEGDKYIWPSGYTHSKNDSLELVMLCQDLGVKVTDIFTIQMLVKIVQRIDELGDRINGSS